MRDPPHQRTIAAQNPHPFFTMKVLKALPRKKPDAHTNAETRLANEIERIATIIERIEKLEPFTSLRNRKQFYFFSFVHGVLVGFGSVLGATVLIAFFIFILKQIQFAPLIGNFVQDILTYIRPQ